MAGGTEPEALHHPPAGEAPSPKPRSRRRIRAKAAALGAALMLSGTGAQLSSASPPPTAVVAGTGGGDYSFPSGVHVHLQDRSLPGGSKISVTSAPPDAVAAAKTMAQDDGPEEVVPPFTIETARELAEPAQLTVSLSSPEPSPNEEISFVSEYSPADGRWSIDGGDYNPANASFTARIRRHLTLDVFRWPIRRMRAWAKRVSPIVFTPTGSAQAPTCGPPGEILWQIDGGDDGLLPHCGEKQEDGSLLVRIVNARPYRLRLVMVEGGLVPDVEPEEGFNAALAALVERIASPGVRLLAGGGMAAIRIPPGRMVELVTERSGLSLAVDVFKTGLNLFAALGSFLGAGHLQLVAAALSTGLETAGCAVDLLQKAKDAFARTVRAAARLARAAFECIKEAATETFPDAIKGWIGIVKAIPDLVERALAVAHFVQDPPARTIILGFPTTSPAAA